MRSRRSATRCGWRSRSGIKVSIIEPSPIRGGFVPTTVGDLGLPSDGSGRYDDFWQYFFWQYFVDWHGAYRGRFFPPFFGMYTRRTGTARAGPARQCSSIASSARPREVRATCPSMPGVWRPVVRWVTRRTLTSVLARLRSASFCRLRTCFRSLPAPP